MKCFSCGTETKQYLCNVCQTPEILDKVFNEICFFKQDECQNPFLLEYVSGLTQKFEERDCIPAILSLFTKDINSYYFCKYYRICRNPLFEEKAIEYISSNSISSIKTQRVLYDLLVSYLRNDYFKPQKWCEIILSTDNLCCELYASAAQNYSMIGDYDLSDMVVDKAMAYCLNSSASFLFYSVDNMIALLREQKSITNRYRTVKPYWPNTEERRRAVALLYDEKGITYPRIDKKPTKTPENEFAPIRENYDEDLTNYCAFWCAETFSISAAKCIYQIAAARVEDSKVVDTFQSYIRPWDGGSKSRIYAAKDAGVELEVIEGAEDVDIVITRFFNFVGTNILVSTDALGNQARLLSRAARKAGMKEIVNALNDLLDLATKKDSNFDNSNCTREYLLSHFDIPEGSDSLGKALNNFKLYQLLSNYVN